MSNSFLFLHNLNASKSTIIHIILRTEKKVENDFIFITKTSSCFISRLKLTKHQGELILHSLGQAFDLPTILVK